MPSIILYDVSFKTVIFHIVIIVLKSIIIHFKQIKTRFSIGSFDFELFNPEITSAKLWLLHIYILYCNVYSGVCNVKQQYFVVV